MFFWEERGKRVFDGAGISLHILYLEAKGQAAQVNFHLNREQHLYGLKGLRPPVNSGGTHEQIVWKQNNEGGGCGGWVSLNNSLSNTAI